jgi:iron-sulfur cluster assembly protein
MAIQLTENAAGHVRSMLSRKQGAIGLRLGARKSGCSGFAYMVDYARQVDEGDRLFESKGIKIVIDSASLPMLDGMTVDYVKVNMLNEGFEFINPNVRNQCGCGESFSV